MLTVTSHKPRFGLENLEAASELLSRNEGPGASTERLPPRPHMGVMSALRTGRGFGVRIASWLMGLIAPSEAISLPRCLIARLFQERGVCLPCLGHPSSSRGGGGETLNPPDEPNHPCAHEARQRRQLGARWVASLCLPTRRMRSPLPSATTIRLFDSCGVEKRDDWHVRFGILVRQTTTTFHAVPKFVSPCATMSSSSSPAGHTISARRTLSATAPHRSAAHRGRGRDQAGERLRLSLSVGGTVVVIRARGATECNSSWPRRRCR